MSEEFDLTAATALAWEQFEERFAAFLADMEPGEALVITIQSAASEEEVSPYLQLAAEEDYLRLEVSSNTYLTDHYALTPYDEKMLVAVGLGTPTCGANNLYDGAGSPNFFLDVDCTGETPEFENLADTATRILRDVLSVPHPAFLYCNPLLDTPDDLEADDPEPSPVVAPVTREHLLHLVTEALTPMLGFAPFHCDNGDIPICEGDIVVFVRVHPYFPTVELWSCVVDEVTDPVAAAYEVGVLNRDSTFIRYVVRDTRVTAHLAIPANPFVADHLMTLLRLMMKSLTKAEPDLLHRVGRGRFSPSPAAEMAARSAALQAAADPAPEPLPLFRHLQAVAPEMLDEHVVARICGADPDIIRELIQWNENDTALLDRAHRDAQEDEDEAAEAIIGTQLRLAKAMTALLLAAL